MKRLGLATAALVLALCSVAAAQGAPSAQDEPNTLLDASPIQRAPAARTAPRYFIDFRARWALSYGHTFVVFGRTGERLTPRNVAGLHPKGDSSFTSSAICCRSTPKPARATAISTSNTRRHATASG